MEGTYYQRGGLRWGECYELSMGATFPLAEIRVGSDRMDIAVGIWPFAREFVFSRKEVSELRRYDEWLLLSFGVQVIHTNTAYPPFICFWSPCQSALLQEASALGWSVE